MYVQSTSDKMAASEYSRLLGAQKEASRMDGHHRHQMVYPTSQQMIYHNAALRGSIQTGLPTAPYLGIETSRSQHSLVTQDVPTIASSAAYQHHVPGTSFPHSFQHPSHYSQSSKCDQLAYRRDQLHAASVGNVPHNTPNQAVNQKSPLSQRSEGQHLPKSFDHMPYAPQTHLYHRTPSVSASQHVDRLKSTHNHLISSSNIKGYAQQSVKASHPDVHNQTQMHLNYNHHNPTAGIHPSYRSSSDRRVETALKANAVPSIDYTDPARGLRGQRMKPDVPVGSHSLHRPTALDSSSSGAAKSIIQSLPGQQSHHTVLGASNTKDNTAKQYKSTHQGQPVMYLNRDYSTQRVPTTNILKEALVGHGHGSIQTGVPLDLSRVSEKSQTKVRETDSPLDLSIKTRKRCADTTISQYGSDTGMSLSKKQMTEARPSLNAVNQHYRNHLIESMDSGLKEGYKNALYHSQMSSQSMTQRLQTYPPMTNKESVTVKADNSAAKSAGLLPKTLSADQTKSNLSFQSQKPRQVNSSCPQSVKAMREATVELSPYPYSVYSGNQSSVVRCSPDSTNISVQNSNKHQQNIYKHPMNPMAYNELSHSHQLKSQSPKTSTRIDVRSNNAYSQVPKKPLPVVSHTAKSSNVAFSPNQITNQNQPFSPSSQSGISKHEPHMQLYPKYDKQSLSGPLPNTFNSSAANKAKAPAPVASIYKTHVKPPELMGMTTDNQENSSIQPLINASESKIKAERTDNFVVPRETVSKRESPQEGSEKYMEPLSIAIPLSKTETSTKTVKLSKETEEIIKSPNPAKMLSRKQMIMNAVYQDENLKKYATNIPHVVRKSKVMTEFKTPRGSPSSPPSPKMPILSPQQKALPSVSPLHSDPPQLDPLDNPSKQRLKNRLHTPLQKRSPDKTKPNPIKVASDNVASTLVNPPNTEGNSEQGYPRPEAVRRNSLPEKTWMYNKNIPVANVAPFVHSEGKQQDKTMTNDSTTTLQRTVTEDDTKPEDVSVLDIEQKSNVIVDPATVGNIQISDVKVSKSKQNDKSSTDIKSMKRVSKKHHSDKTKHGKVRKEKHQKDKKTKKEKNSNHEKSSEGEAIIPKVEDAEPKEEPMDESADVSASDPSQQLDREERAIRRAIDQFIKMENGTKPSQNNPCLKKLSNANKRARELKRKAIGRGKLSGHGVRSKHSRRSRLQSTGFPESRAGKLRTRSRTSGSKLLKHKKILNKEDNRHSIKTLNDSDVEFDDDDDDDEDYEDDDDDDDATEYEYDSEDMDQDRVLRRRVSLRTRKRSSKRLMFNDTESDQDDTDQYEDNNNNNKVKSRKTSSKKKTRQSRQRSIKKRPDGEEEVANLFTEESTEDEFDAAYFHQDNNNLLIPQEVKKITLNKSTGESGLHKAIRLNYQEAVLYYLKSGTIDVNIKDNGGYTPLHEACICGSLMMVRTLLEYGADINASAQDGKRPIHDAVQYNHIEVIRMLLAYGADPNVQTKKGKSIMHISHLSSTNKFLQGYFGDLNGVDSETEEIPWLFCSSYSLDATESGCNIFSEIPSDPEIDDENDMFDDEVTSAIRVFDLDLYNIGRSESYVFGEDIQTQFNCNETRLRKLMPPEMDIIKLPTEKLEKLFENSVVRCPVTSAPAVYLFKYSFFKLLKEKLAPNIKCNNVSELISYRNKITDRKNTSGSAGSSKSTPDKNSDKHNSSKKQAKSTDGQTNSSEKERKSKDSSHTLKTQLKKQKSTSETQKSEACSSGGGSDGSNTKVKKRLSSMLPSPHVVLNKDIIINLDKKQSFNKSRNEALAKYNFDCDSS